jgi:fructose-1,6-bisphosphatase II
MFWATTVPTMIAADVGALPTPEAGEAPRTTRGPHRGQTGLPLGDAKNPPLAQPLLAWALEATRAAALAAARWAGRGEAKAADAAATDAMRAILDSAPGAGVVVTGEGAKDSAPMLADGERLGDDARNGYDIAVDPLECTDLCAAGLPGALSTIAIAPRGSLWSPGRAYYMDKLVLGARLAGCATLDHPPEEVVGRLRERLGREPRIVVLDKPRHRELIVRLRAAGASVATPSAGDVAGALQALVPGGSADCLLGIGGTPEGVLAACAARALGGQMEGRLAPQREDERAALDAAGVDLTRLLALDELVGGPATFIATGVTGGMLAAPCTDATGWQTTESLVIAAGAVHRILQSTPTEE